MASVHRDPRHPRGPWSAAFRLADGRRAYRSTGTCSKYKAKAIADAWEAADREAASGELTRARVGAILEETLLRLGHPRAGARFRCAMARGMARRKKARGSRPASSSKAYAQACGRSLPRPSSAREGARRRLECDQHERDVEGFVAMLRKIGAFPGDNQRGPRARRGRSFEKARRTGRVAFNAFAAVEAEKSDARPRATFSPGAIAALLKVASPDWQGAILFGYSTGARLGDVANLKWSEPRRCQRRRRLS